MADGFIWVQAMKRGPSIDFCVAKNHVLFVKGLR